MFITCIIYSWLIHFNDVINYYHKWVNEYICMRTSSYEDYSTTTLLFSPLIHLFLFISYSLRCKSVRILNQFLPPSKDTGIILRGPIIFPLLLRWLYKNLMSNSPLRERERERVRDRVGRENESYVIPEAEIYKCGKLEWLRSLSSTQEKKLIPFEYHRLRAELLRLETYIGEFKGVRSDSSYIF